MSASGTNSSRAASVFVATVTLWLILQCGSVIAQAAEDDGTTTDMMLTTEEEVVATVKPNVPCDSPPCIQKCCEDGKMFDEELECVHANNSLWSPTMFFGGREDVDPSKLQIVYGFPTGCAEEDIILHEAGPFYLLQDDTMESENGSQSELTSRYCLEYLYEDLIGVYCSPIEEEEPDTDICSWHQVLYPILMLFSIFFLILTLAVYAAVPNLRNLTYGRCLMSLVTALLVFYILQTTINYQELIHSSSLCITLAFFMHLTGLTIFFWLNVMAFEIWYLVRSGKKAEHTWKKFMLYSLYAWGCPLLISSVTVIIESLPEDINVLRPNLVGSTCFLEGKMVKWTYLYWVILVICLVNLYFIIYVWYTVYSSKKKVAEMSNRRSVQDGVKKSVKKDDQKLDYFFPMLLKMFLIMGVTWIIEIPSTGACLWVIGDLFNLLQGVSIFIATVCTEKTYKEIKNWLSPDKPFFSRTTKYTSAPASSTAIPNSEA
ncbi:unnamed protein product [Meganyctiphanes norvegica]|uniref:G-protein coupled receptors family 2 profile 2 domain-containing protein n=1 Tax=Meganyctiphanes norvegica TaxID=48144 RepID=A0AAV2Q3Y0_MEGNR